ncbi:MAG: tRNA preQ1(34) S-adenosylmethionine ribosyltransferase-isomerase QueA [Eubacterium sp.]|nr:tRNA preQ1(34) S-adenosylmethionine ribosyltransferase-isomerase QueA [Eubacterium sp.]MBR1532400.1 tRNA preQ1(34) S-adenosylmethionine ribosyltransferase-isomerase QueA [Eubacterium sp.]
MKTSDFFYELPQNLIAQTPVEPRDSSRLMVLDKTSGEIEHRIFRDLTDYLHEGDCLVLNDTRVIPARIYGVKKETGAVVEFLLLKQKENNCWECLCKPGKRAKIGTEFVFGEGIVDCEVCDITDDGNRIIRFNCDSKEIYNILDKIGKMPLPPYITEELKNGERYQTVYSRELGSAAAPTAGLHFTKEMLKKIEDMGVKVCYVTLHVGLGTFRPVKVDDVTQHKMHSEHYQISKETADIINQTKQNGKRVISVGTTSTRTLESVATKNGCICEDEDDTSIFIYPGYEFKCVDALVTNFHLPESTLIMLVSALAGYDNIMNAYKTAVEEKYRFFSFGDAMLIL